MSKTQADDRFIDIREVEKLICCKYGMIYKMIRAGKFPPPIKLGCAARWSLNAVQEWMAEKVREAA